jgi:hypothetical protein
MGIVVMCLILDPPDVSIEENWLQKPDMSWEVELVCTAHANPPAEVRGGGASLYTAHANPPAEVRGCGASLYGPRQPSSRGKGRWS